MSSLAKGRRASGFGGLVRLTPERFVGDTDQSQPPGLSVVIASGEEVEKCGYARALHESGIGRTGGDCAVLGKEGDGIPHTRGIRTLCLAGMFF